MFMKPSFVSRLFSHVSQQSHEATAWLKRYARNPRNVGSILPSSKMLGRAMTSAALCAMARAMRCLSRRARATARLRGCWRNRWRGETVWWRANFCRRLRRNCSAGCLKLRWRVVGCRICRIGRRRAIKRLCRRCRFAVWRRMRRGISARFYKASCTKTRARCWCSLPTG